MTADNWLLDVKLRISGRGRVGADGMVKELCLFSNLCISKQGRFLVFRRFGLLNKQVLKVQYLVRMIIGKVSVFFLIHSITMHW